MSDTFSSSSENDRNSDKSYVPESNSDSCSSSDISSSDRNSDNNSNSDSSSIDPRSSNDNSSSSFYSTDEEHILSSSDDNEFIFPISTVPIEVIAPIEVVMPIEIIVPTKVIEPVQTVNEPEEVNQINLSTSPAVLAVLHPISTTDSLVDSIDVIISNLSISINFEFSILYYTFKGQRFYSMFN